MHHEKMGFTSSLFGLLGLCLAAAACSSDAPEAGPPHGAPGEISDVDPDSMQPGKRGRVGGAGGISGGGGPVQGGTSGAGSASGSGATSGATTLPPVHGVSAPCDLESDCDAALICNYDASDYIAHKQCSLSCDSDETCTSAFGQSSFCIGAHLCVHACTSDAGCLARTHCNSAGWCERGGPGSGVPYCAGFATPCGLLSGVECTGASGCRDDSKCSGVPTSCYSLFDSYSCSSQRGCNWSTYNKNCSGFASSCSGSSEYSCTSQRGCNWSGGCMGTPESCGKKDVSSCSTQPGCRLQTD